MGLKWKRIGGAAVVPDAGIYLVDTGAGLLAAEVAAGEAPPGEGPRLACGPVVVAEADPQLPGDWELVSRHQVEEGWFASIQSDSLGAALTVQAATRAKVAAALVAAIDALD